MAHSHPNHREITLKVVYYGPGLAGKTTSLNYLHRALRPDTRGQIVAVTTGGDRTMFFDFFPLPSPRLQGNALRVQLYTTPGEVRSDSTRRGLLEGLDGLVFVADSQRGREMDNAESLEQLRKGLGLLGLHLEQLPHVFAWNKRDMDNLLSPAELAARLNRENAPAFETVATTGRGVFDTLKAVTGLVLSEMTRRRTGRTPPSRDSVNSTGRRLQAVSEAQKALAGMIDRTDPVREGLAGARGQDPHVPDMASSLAASAQRLQSESGALGPRRRLQRGPDARRDPSAGSGLAATTASASPGENGRDSLPPFALRGPAPAPVDRNGTARDESFSRIGPGTGAAGGRLGRPASVPPSHAKARPEEIVSSPEGVSIRVMSDEPGRPSAYSEETQPRKRASPTPLHPLAPQPSALPTEGQRDVWISHLLPQGPLRDQLHHVELDLATGHCAQAVRRATGIFTALTSAEAAREADEGQAWRALALGIPVDRYLRFREATRHAEAGIATLEDGLFSLFFLMDTILRK